MIKFNSVIAFLFVCLIVASISMVIFPPKTLDAQSQIIEKKPPTVPKTLQECEQYYQKSLQSAKNGDNVVLRNSKPHYFRSIAYSQLFQNCIAR